MREKIYHFSKRWSWLFVACAVLLASGIAIITLPNNVPTANKRGNSNVYQLASNNTAGSAGATLCDDGSGNATESGCTGGGGGAAGASLFSTTGTTTVVATSPTTLIGTVTGSTTIAANTFTAGQVMQFRAQGYYTSPATSASLKIDLLVGGSIQITTGSNQVLASTTNGTWKLDCDITTETAGSGGTQIANCMFVMTGTLFTPRAYAMPATSTWSINTTTTNVVDLQATWSTSTGAPTLTSTTVAAWIPGAPVSSVFGLTGAVSPTGHNISAVLDCADTSSSATTYTCSTSPSFSPTGTDMVLFNSINQNNTGSATLNVNGAGAKTIKKQQGAANLAANDFQANGSVLLAYDGTNWQVQGQIGNAGGGGGGSFTLVEEHTASSSATLPFTTCLTSTYDDYEIDLIQFIPASDGQPLQMQVSTNGGSTYDTGSNYSWTVLNVISNTSGSNGQGSDTSMTLFTDQSAGSPGPTSTDAMIRFHNPLSASLWKNLFGNIASWDTSGGRQLVNIWTGTYKSTTAVNAFRFLYGSGNIEQGTARCYGLSH
jgi:hypothetical protein